MVAEGYKETEIGVIPEEWEVVKLKNILTIGSGKDYKYLDKGDIPVYGTGGFMLSVNKYLYDGESVCIGRKGTIDKPMFLTGKFWTVDTLFYTHLFKDIKPKFLYYLFLQIDWKKYNEASGVPSLSKKTIEVIQIPLPPLKEQEKIADILSTADEKIDAIASQIQKAETLKKGLLQKLLSEGIGHSECEDSELGKIPVNWEINDLEKATTYVDYRGKTPTKTKNGVFLITARNIKGNKIDYSLSNEYIAEKDYETVMSRGKPQVGDVLLTTEAPLGQIASVDKEYVALAQRIIKYRGVENYLDNSFLKHYFISSKFQDLLLLNSTGSTVKGIKGSRLKKLKIAIPPLEEQQQIADILSTADEKLEVLRAKKQMYETLKKGLLQKLLSGEVRV